MKIFPKNEILIIIVFSQNLFLIFCDNALNDNLNTFISSPRLIKNQLCSFNEINKINSTYIECKCYGGFVKDNNIRKINNYEVDCSYLLKSRLITLGLSLMIPIGIDYFYLGHYIVFFIIFLSVIVIIILNIRLLKLVLIYDKLSSVGNVDIKFEKKYIRTKLIILIVDLVFFILYLINAILQGTGVFKDSNGFPTIYDYPLDS